MYKYLMAFAFCAVTLLAQPNHADAANAQHAKTKQPIYTWHGPPCGNGNAVCSIDPPPPGGSPNFPCYESFDPTYTPTRLQMQIIDICWAAATILDDAPKNRAKDIKSLNLHLEIANLLARQDPYQLLGHPFAQLLPSDVKTYRSDLEIYHLDPTPANWAALDNDLGLIVSDATVYGGQ